MTRKHLWVSKFFFPPRKMEGKVSLGFKRNAWVFGQVGGGQNLRILWSWISIILHLGLLGAEVRHLKDSMFLISGADLGEKWPIQELMGEAVLSQSTCIMLGSCSLDIVDNSRKPTQPVTNSQRATHCLSDDKEKRPESEAWFGTPSNLQGLLGLLYNV